MIEHVDQGCQCEGKVCKQCESRKCLHAFSPDKKGKQQRQSRCKACRNGSFKERYYADLENRRAYNLAHYYKHKEQYNAKSRADPKKREQRKASYQRRRETVLATQKVYRQANPEKVRQSKQAEYQRHASRYIRRARIYHQDHPEAARRWANTFRKNHPDQFTARKHRRRALLAQNGGHFTADQWRCLKEQYDYTCLCCGRKEPDIHLCADHIIPVVRNGTSNIENIQPLCRSCNSKKHSKIIDYRPKGDENNGRSPGLF